MWRSPLCVFAALALCASVGTGLLRKGSPEIVEVPVQDRVVALQPVLEKLSNLDPKTFSLLNGMLSQATGTTSEQAAPKQHRAASFLQYVREHPVDAEAALEKLGPILDKLKGLDPKAFGALSSVMSQATGTASEQTTPTQHRAASFLQYVREHPVDAEAALEKLGPILDKLKGLDPKAFGAALHAISKSDPQGFGALPSVLSQAASPNGKTKDAALLQKSTEEELAPGATAEDPDFARKLEALAPVLGKLKGLDGKAFGMLNGLVAQAEEQASSTSDAPKTRKPASL